MNLMRMLMTVLGVLASLLMLCVSGAMNYLFLSSLGKTMIEGQVLGAASAAADALKALLPFFIFWGWRAGHYSVALPGMLVWVFFSGFSLLSAIGFAADNRGAFSHTRESLNAAYDSALADLSAAETKLKDLPKHRPVSIVTEEIDRRKQDRRWSSTKECSDATLPESREFCDEYFALRAELASGIEAGRTEHRIVELKSETARLRESGAGQDVDPQVSLLARLFGHAESRVRLGLTLIVALLVEIGSSLGLFLSASHSELFGGRGTEATGAPINSGNAPPPKPTPPASPPNKSAREKMRAGLVEDFCLECLVADDNANLTLAELFEGYSAWCKNKNHQPLKSHAFEGAFRTLAGKIGLSLADGCYNGIAFARKPNI